MESTRSSPKNLEPGSRLHVLLLNWSKYFAIAILAIVILVFVGWQWDIAFLKQPIPHLTPMSPLTAFAFLLAAASFLGLSLVRQLVARVLALFVLLTGLLKITDPAILSGQMTPQTACCFILSGFSLLLLTRGTKSGRGPAQYIALLIAVVGLFSILGYLYRVRPYDGAFAYRPMAPHTAICFLFLSVALLLANPGKGIMKELTSGNTGGFTSRSLLPLVILLPVILGYLRLMAYWKGLISTEFGVDLLISAIVLAFVIIVWFNARLLNHRDEQKKAVERSLLDSEARNRLLVSSVKDYAIFMLDPAGQVISWNEGAERIKGYKKEEIIGRDMSVFYTPEEIQRGEPQYNLVQAKAQGRFEQEGWRVRKDGSIFWANVVVTAIHDPDGDILGYAKVTRDMTERKRATEQIAYMARLMEDTSDAIFSTDSSFVIRTWNKAAELLFGYKVAEVRGQSASKILRTQQSDEFVDTIRAEMAAAGYWKGEVYYLTKNSSLVTVLLSASAVRDAEGELDGFVMVCRDISERKKMELQLHQFNRELEQQVSKKTSELTGIFERITDAFIAMDKNLCYTYLNKKAGELIHRDPATLIGKYVWDVFPDAVGSDTWQAFNKAMAEQKNMTNTDYYAPLDLWQENHLYPSPEGLSVFIRNVTEDKKRETERKKAEDLLEKSYQEIRQLASHLQDVREEERACIAREIHDELGQQLTGLKMDLSWIGKRKIVQEDIEVRQKVLTVMSLLDTTIMTVRRIATDLRPSVLDDLGLIAAIEWQSEEFEKRSGISTTFISTMEECRYSSMISIGLFRICQESLTNVARHANASRVRISLEEQGNANILLKIEDNGKGFDVGKIGEKKTLGLLGMRERTLMMGGQFRMESQTGRGTTLFVTVPLTANEYNL